MKKKIVILLLSIFTLSILAALLLTVLGKYFIETRFYYKPFFQYFIYYIILVFFIQIIACFWIVYFLDDYLINRKLNILIISLISGLCTFLIIELLAYLKFEAYYFEPFKHKYQIISFFFVGFFYPHISKYLKYRIYKN
jgi:hypothetical protein